MLAVAASAVGLDVADAARAEAAAVGPAVSSAVAPATGATPVTAWAASVHTAFERQAQHAVAAAHAAFTQSGVASWYGKEFAGRRTSSGVRFNPLLLTCAHRTQPLGSRLLVTSEATGRSVVVTVTDRGPYAGRDRIIDLSRAAARRIGMVGDGVDQVTVERIPAGEVEVAQAADVDSSNQAIRASR